MAYSGVKVLRSEWRFFNPLKSAKVFPFHKQNYLALVRVKLIKTAIAIFRHQSINASGSSRWLVQSSGVSQNKIPNCTRSPLWFNLHVSSNLSRHGWKLWCYFTLNVLLLTLSTSIQLLKVKIQFSNYTSLFKAKGLHI